MVNIWSCFVSCSLPSKAGLSYRELSWEFNSPDIEKHPSEGTSGFGKPGKILTLKPECGLREGGWDKEGKGCKWGNRDSGLPPPTLCEARGQGEGWEGRLELAFTRESEWLRGGARGPGLSGSTERRGRGEEGPGMEEGRNKNNHNSS